MRIIVDTREKLPWLFGFSTASISHQKLNTGDYSIEGLEDVLCIERKKSVSELANNITTDRFQRELERMSQFPYKFLILEFNYEHVCDFPYGSNIPRHLRVKVRIRGPFIMKCLAEIKHNYDICILPCTNALYAEHVAYGIMKEIHEGY